LFESRQHYRAARPLQARGTRLSAETPNDGEQLQIADPKTAELAPTNALSDDFGAATPALGELLDSEWAIARHTWHTSSEVRSAARAASEAIGITRAE